MSTWTPTPPRSVAAIVIPAALLVLRSGGLLIRQACHPPIMAPTFSPLNMRLRGKSAFSASPRTTVVLYLYVFLRAQLRGRCAVNYQDCTVACLMSECILSLETSHLLPQWLNWAALFLFRPPECHQQPGPARRQTVVRTGGNNQDHAPRQTVARTGGNPFRWSILQ